MSETGLSTNEAGGLLAGAIAVLGLIGGGVRWLGGWQERRLRSREAKLQVWHDELVARQRELDGGATAYTKKLERRIDDLELAAERRIIIDKARDGQVTALRIVVDLLSNALRAIDPVNSALSMAHDILANAFPVKLGTPPDMIAALGAIEEADRSRA